MGSVCRCVCSSGAPVCAHLLIWPRNVGKENHCFFVISPRGCKFPFEVQGLEIFYQDVTYIIKQKQSSGGEMVM